ncbi:polysaccharide biosynthesis tyrosine autokinase [Ideonella sp. A 288]|uniref:polysaccharide biosynthesis tyrosine autokinase n=1 Tax=Ideonella sp. A 288 TaxID=1962181 RepID=UPI000B4A7879|nr:polysaccharide biosynthesis tyrosine autokinase [Ideonella sp. A 288]
MAFVVPPTWRAWLRADRGPGRGPATTPSVEPLRSQPDLAAPACEPSVDATPDRPGPQAPRAGHRAVGQHLRESALLDDAQIEAVLSLQRAKGLRFGEAALSLDLVTREQLLQALARQFEFPLLAPGPCGLAPELVVAHDPFGVAAEHYRSLRSQLMGSGVADDAPRRALAVVSSGVGDGKSTTAANLAISFSQLGLRTLLVDANLRRPSVHRLFGLDRPMGLGALLGGQPDTAPCGVDGLPGLSLLPAGGQPPNPLELIERPAFALLMQGWLERFDQVIVDTPAAAHGADARVLAARCGSALVVARPGRTAMAPVHRLVQALRAGPARLHGVVFHQG